MPVTRHSKAHQAFLEWKAELRAVSLEQERANIITAPLFHYTTADSACKIIQSSILRFTDYRHMNDGGELAHGLGLVRGAIEEFGKSHPDEFTQFLCRRQLRFVTLENFDDVFVYHIASMTKRRDHLPQFRLYSNDTRGVALGFSPAFFKPVQRRQPYRDFWFSAVEYDDNRTVSRMRSALGRARKLIFDIAPTISSRLLMSRQIDLIGMNLAGIVTVLAAQLAKSSGYEHEEEVRLFRTGVRSKMMPFIQFRPDGAPFIPHPLPMLGNLVEVTLGSSISPDDQRAVNEAIFSIGLDPSKIVKQSQHKHRALSRVGSTIESAQDSEPRV